MLKGSAPASAIPRGFKGHEYWLGPHLPAPRGQEAGKDIAPGAKVSDILNADCEWRRHQEIGRPGAMGEGSPIPVPMRKDGEKDDRL
jgi:hypothetical protein